MLTAKPLQTVSYAKKMANNKQWCKDTIDFYIGRADFGGSTAAINSTKVTKGQKIKQNRDLYNNIIPEEWFDYVTNPLNVEDEKFKRFPSKIRPYPFLRPNLDLIRGEYKKRPFNYIVSNLGEDAYSSYQEFISKSVVDNLQQQFINEANQLGAQTGIDSKEVPMPKKLEEEINSTYKDLKAIQGQKALGKCLEDLDLRNEFQKMFKDWILAGEVRSHKDVNRGDIQYRRFAPENVWAEKSPDEEYIEDGEAVVARLNPTISDLVDMFYEDLSKEMIDTLEMRGTDEMSRESIFLNFSSLFKGNTVELLHCCWKSKVEKIRLSYIDHLTGELQEDIVDEDYKVNKDEGEHGEVEYHNEVWEGYRLTVPVDPNKDNSEDRYIYLRVRPIPVQRNLLNNFSYCKLPYNGKNFAGQDTTDNIAPIDFGIPYQKLYIIIWWNLEKTIANSKGKIVLMDQSVLPDEEDNSMDKFFYNAFAMNFAIINRAKQNADKTFNQYNVLDMTLFDSIKQLIDLLHFLEDRWDAVLGITRQRKGQVQASDTVGGTERSVFQSSVISEMMFNEFDQFVKVELQGILDCTKLAWGDTGKKALYYRDNIFTELLEIEGPEFMDSELGVFLLDAGEEADNLSFLKNNIQSFIQNNVKASSIVEMTRSKNIEELKSILRKAEEEEIRTQQAMAENEEAAKRETIRIQQEFKEFENFLAIDKMNKEYDRKEQIEYIKGDVAIHTFQGTDDTDANLVPDIAEIEARANDRQSHYETVRSNQAKENIEREKLKVKREEIKTKAETEKMKAKTALKNKVTGEK